MSQKTDSETTARTLRLSPTRDETLAALASHMSIMVDDLVEELVRDGIAIEEADFPALKGCTTISGGVHQDFFYAWIPGQSAERFVLLPTDLDLRIRQIAFAQGRPDGNVFASLVDKSLTRALLRT